MGELPPPPSSTPVTLSTGLAQSENRATLHIQTVPPTIIIDVHTLSMC